MQEENGRHQPFEQITFIEGFLEAGEVGLSAEVIEQVRIVGTMGLPTCSPETTLIKLKHVCR